MDILVQLSILKSKELLLFSRGILIRGIHIYIRIKDFANMTHEEYECAASVEKLKLKSVAAYIHASDDSD